MLRSAARAMMFHRLLATPQTISVGALAARAAEDKIVVFVNRSGDEVSDCGRLSDICCRQLDIAAGPGKERTKAPHPSLISKKKRLSCHHCLLTAMNQVNH